LHESKKMQKYMIA